MRPTSIGLDTDQARHRRDPTATRTNGPDHMKHLLVTNDFPPKIGGIQSLLWEWWRRLPADRFAVLTSPYEGADAFDAGEPYRIERTREPVLLPHPWMVRRIDDLADDFGADLVVLDPAVPLGLVGPSLRLPYDLVLHGAEVTVPGRLPGTSHALAYTLRPCSPRHRRRGLPVAGGRTRSGPATAHHRRAVRRRSGTVHRCPATTRTAQRAGVLRSPGGCRGDRRDLPSRATQRLRHGDPGREPAQALAARPPARDRRRWTRHDSVASTHRGTRRARAIRGSARSRRRCDVLRLR